LALHAKSRDAQYCAVGLGPSLPKNACHFEQEQEHEQERGEAYFATAF
jgi:hypothetical protein